MIQVIMILIVVAFTIISAKIDSDHFKAAQYFTDHSTRAVQRGLFLIAASGFSWTLFILFAAIFFALFDFSLNSWRGMRWDYSGENAKTDRFFRKHPGLQYPIKIGLLVLAIIINIKF